MKPRLFISAVTAELGHTRQLVANVLSRLGYDPVWQDIFGTEPGDLRQVLRDKIDGCDGLIQIVGRGYGAEPPPVVDAVSGVTSHTEFGRVSYTQFEFLYAQSRGKKTWLIFADDGCTRDRPLEQLDLPLQLTGSSAPCGPSQAEGFRHKGGAYPSIEDPLAYQAERRALQEAWRQRWREHVHLRHEAANDTELELKIERLKDEFAELRRQFSAWQRNMMRISTAIGLLLTVVGLGVSWMVIRQGEVAKEVVEQVTDKVTQAVAEQLAELKPELIREQLNKTIEQTYQQELGQADSLPDWRKRDEAKKAAAESRDRRLGQVDEFLRSITATIQSGDASPEFLELTRIVGEQGVEAALQYVTSQQSRLLESVASLTAQHEREVRRKLAPLLEAVRLHQTRGELRQAEELCDKLLAADANWPEALHEHFWTQIELGDRALRYELRPSPLSYGGVELHHPDFTAAMVHYQKVLKISQKLAADPTDAQAQRDLSISYNRLGDVQLQSGQVTEALRSYQKGLEIRQKLAAADPSDAQAQSDLVVSFVKVGEVTQQAKDYKTAVTWYEKALTVLERLDAAGRLPPSQKKWIEIVQQAIADCKKSMMTHKE